MRLNGIRLIIAVILGTVFCFNGNLLAEEEIPDEILIDNKGYKYQRKGPVTFTHLSHAEDYDVECAQCHHIYKDGKNIWEEGDEVQKCISCHSPKENKGEIKNLRLSFHKNCKNCHKQTAKEGISEDAPYRKCQECHE